MKYCHNCGKEYAVKELGKPVCDTCYERLKHLKITTSEDLICTIHNPVSHPQHYTAHPSGIAQDYKQDAGKIRLSTVPASLERAVAEIREIGIAKYGDNQKWRDVAPERYFDAMLRHINAMRDQGIDSLDSESGCRHLHHVACNVAFLIEILQGVNNARQCNT